MCVSNVQCARFTIRFPTKDFQLQLNIPREIQIGELTEIIRNYTQLHTKYGFKCQSKQFQPIFLSTVSGNITADAFLQNQQSWQQQLACINETDMTIQYIQIGFMAPENNPLMGYKIYGFRQTHHYRETVTRSLKDGKLYSIFHQAKSSLNFEHVENLILMKQKLIKWSSEAINISVDLQQVFESQNYVNFVVGFVAVKLNLQTFTDRLNLESCISQIAKILHILMKDNINLKGINIEDFGIDFKGRVKLINVLVLQSLSVNDQQQQDLQKMEYSNTFATIVENIFKNSEISIIQSFLPLHHCLKSNKIATYADYLKYYRFGRKCEINSQAFGRFNPSQSLNRCKKTHHLLANAKKYDLEQFNPAELDELRKPYESQTSIFRYKCMTKYSQSAKVQQFLGLESENIMSTVKKVKNKETKKIKTRQARNNKSTKSQKPQRKISEFLIED